MTVPPTMLVMAPMLLTLRMSLLIGGQQRHMVALEEREVQEAMVTQRYRQVDAAAKRPTMEAKRAVSRMDLLRRRIALSSLCGSLAIGSLSRYAARQL